MTKYRKKPIVVEAEQFDPKDQDQHRRLGVWPFHDVDNGTLTYSISTLEGVLDITEGDWIITGVAQERYPCKDSIFKQTYVPVEPVGDPTDG